MVQPDWEPIQPPVPSNYEHHTSGFLRDDRPGNDKSQDFMTFCPGYQVSIGIFTPYRNFSTASMILQDALDGDRSTLVGVCKRSRDQRSMGWLIDCRDHAATKPPKDLLAWAPVEQQKLWLCSSRASLLQDVRCSESGLSKAQISQNFGSVHY